ncbi:MAG: tRNA dihydrouridine(20/20a) synthase DusA [Aphanocapsa feldmannii 277cV]|uniref:tRNA-dihydrouridine(20/20a) synthase n=2 Tax=Aphanocapsa feldmannii TaxID=192050 RepID=A0A524RPE7_9CHRO|nr:MAG: tRNA dihydrouridine(20/20a) synthase DusA [Aphanocapsa feldmannii 288cV]TGG93181.1 MAG: tRNA dihydrouridine(20/20a) synthase DusA [Aphanocapsa feldmannii 277cV]TGH20184.1 MAG: tRNA dihydrouridine(20/20a) synthase DusA [Aphanocapsa feldmannii 277cI]
MARHRFSVAPMMDCTDRHYRVLMRQISGKALLYSEMVVAQALHFCGAQEGKRERLLDFDPIEHPIALQVGGDDPVLLAEAARLAEAWGYDELNLNLGCPSPRVRAGRFGACLMAEPDHVARCIEAMAEHCRLPVTVKHRTGIDRLDSYGLLLAFVDRLAAAGARRFSVHARKAWLEGLNPSQNRTIPPLRHDLVEQLKRDRPELLIELNGSLLNLSQCENALTKVDAVMVGRAAYEHPMAWVELDRRLHGVQRQPARPSAVVWGVIPYAEAQLRRGGRLWDMARHLVKLVEGVRGARAWRRQLSLRGQARGAGVEVLEQAARQLEDQGL